VRALLSAYLGGQATGEAQFDLLFGDHAPAGKLAETWPLALEDNPSFGDFPGGDERVLYKEGIFVGYRWYASAGRAVRFPFGFGLSYTSFEYSVPSLSRVSIKEGEGVTVGFSLRNAGSRQGTEVAQVYVSFPDSRLERPALALAAFAKRALAPGESARVEVTVSARSLGYWDVDDKAFRVERGRVLLRVGGSSADLPLCLELLVEEGSEPNPRHPKLDLSVHPSAMSDATFGDRLGFAIPPAGDPRPWSLASTLGDMGRDSFLIRVLLSVMVGINAKSSGAEKGSPNYRMFEEGMRETPLSKLMGMSGGRVRARFASGLVDLANGKNIRGILRIFSDLPL
jgi:beta-glucosidase